MENFSDFAALCAGVELDPSEPARLLVLADWLRAHGRDSDAATVAACVNRSGASWVDAWRRGLVPVLPRAGLEALRVALLGDDPRLIQGATTTPPPLMAVHEWPIEAADALGFCGWQGGADGAGLGTVGEVEEFFARACFEADQRLGEPAGCRWFLNHWDGAPRAELFAELAEEIAFALLLIDGRRLAPVAVTEEF